MLAGNEREALLRVADQLSIELGYDEGDEVPAVSSPLSGDRGLMPDILNSEDELLASRMRQGLAKVAVAAGGNSESTLRERGGRCARRCRDGHTR